MGNIKISSNKILRILLLFFLISITAFRLNFYIAVPAYVLILVYSIFIDCKISISKILKWGVLFWGYYLLSIFWSVNINDTLNYVTAIIYEIGILVFFPKIVNSEADVIVTIELIWYSLVFSALFTLLLTPLSYYGTERLGSALNLNSNLFGYRMALGALFSWYITRTIGKPRSKKDLMKKIFVIIMLIIFTFLTFFSGSKKALFFVVGSIAMYEIIVTKGIKKFLKFIGVVVCLIIVIFLIFNNQKMYNVIGERIERMILTISNNNTVNTTDKSYTERQFYIEEAIDYWKQSPIFGNGGNTFVTRMRNINYSHIAYSHNNYTELLCTLGIVGLVLYYSYWLKTFLGLIKIFKSEKKQREKNIALLFSIIILLQFILDYGMVSYIIEFNIMLLCLFDSYVKSFSLKSQETGDEF